MTIEERANLSAIEDSEKGRQRDEYYISALADHENGFREGYIKGATDQRAIDKELIDELIRELYTSRAYHLGVTGLDSKEEIIRKEKEGDCALIRGIDRTIKYVKEAMEE